jgi:nucleotide-binding universal stress UspA family protein
MVAMDAGPDADTRARLAAALAVRFSSRLIGVAARPITAPLYFETPVPGLSSMIEVEERRAIEEIAKAEAMLRRAAGNTGLEWRHAQTLPTNHAVEHARTADLIVAGRPRGIDEALDPMSVDCGDLVMNAGRPVLIVPPKVDYVSAQHVVVGWKNTKEARRAVRDALPFLKGAGEVLVVSAAENDPSADDVVAYLGRHGVSANAVIVGKELAKPADELVRLARQEGADLIVCGAYGHSRTREWVFGGVTRDLLAQSPVCCLMSH